MPKAGKDKEKNTEKQKTMVDPRYQNNWSRVCESETSTTVELIIMRPLSGATQKIE